VLAKRDFSIYFTKTHLADLKTILEDGLENSPSGLSHDQEKAAIY